MEIKSANSSDLFKRLDEIDGELQDFHISAYFSRAKTSIRTGIKTRESRQKRQKNRQKNKGKKNGNYQNCND